MFEIHHGGFHISWLYLSLEETIPAFDTIEKWLKIISRVDPSFASTIGQTDMFFGGDIDSYTYRSQRSSMFRAYRSSSTTDQARLYAFSQTVTDNHAEEVQLKPYLSRTLQHRLTKTWPGIYFQKKAASHYVAYS